MKLYLIKRFKFKEAGTMGGRPLDYMQSRASCLTALSNKVLCVNLLHF